MNIIDTSARQKYMLGGYEILETVGSGGMGVVYRAQDRALDRQVALKVLRDDLRNHPDIVARFQREAEAFASLDHPNIVHIYSVGLENEVPYFAMEFIEGHTLSELVIMEGPMPWPLALDLASQVSDALVCAHRAGIIHRDIKPSNILVTKDHKAFVTDFGIAKLLGAVKKLTVDGSRLGTPQYMSPERCQNKQVTASSDIYALGVVMFKCMTGRLPYRGEGSVAIMRSIVDDQPIRLREFAPETPEAVERLIAYMLEKNPEDRPPSAKAVCEAIERVRRGEKLEGEGDGMTDAIKAFRATIPGVKPDPDTHLTPWTITRRIAPVAKEAVRSGWFSLSTRTRIALGLAVVALSLAVTVASVVALLMQPRFEDVAFGPDGGMSRWTCEQPLAQFVSEQPNVFSVAFDLPHFAIAYMAASPGNERVYIAFDGNAASPREGQHAVYALNPNTLAVSVLVPPEAAQRGHDFAFLGSAAAGDGAGFFVAADGATRFAPFDGGAGALLSAHAAAVLAPCPGSAYAAIAYPDTAGSWTVAEISPESPQRETTHSAAAGPVNALAYSSDGFLLAYLTEKEPGNRALYVGKALLPEDSGEAIATGDIAIGHAPFSPGGERLAIARNVDGSARLEILETGGGRRLAELGPGSEANWLASGAAVAAIAPDDAGVPQVVLIDAQAPYAHTPLTALPGGIGAQLILSGDGRHVIASGSADASAIIASLPSGG